MIGSFKESIKLFTKVIPVLLAALKSWQERRAANDCRIEGACG